MLLTITSNNCILTDQFSYTYMMIRFDEFNCNIANKEILDFIFNSYLFRRMLCVTAAQNYLKKTFLKNFSV